MASGVWWRTGWLSSVYSLWAVLYFLNIIKILSKCKLPKLCICRRFCIVSVFYLPSEISSWGFYSSQEINNQLFSKLYLLMSHLFRPLGRDMESLDHVSWKSKGKDIAISPKALMTLALSSLQSTKEKHFSAEIIYCLRAVELRDLKWCFIKWKRVPITYRISTHVHHTGYKRWLNTKSK